MLGPLSINYDPSVTPQMQAWTEEAVLRCRFPKDRMGITLQITVVEEPSAPGHNDFMCSLIDGSPTAQLQMRAGIDQLDADINQAFETSSQLQTFFQECVVHELGHAFGLVYMATDDDRKTQMAGWFRRDVLGDRRRGTLDDWNADPAEVQWVDRVGEAWAEFFKDLYLPESYRYYEQRTNWTFIEEQFGDFYELLESIICPGS